MKKSQRLAGVLLHISSLPGPEKNGELSEHAFQFVDFLSACGIKMWQILPLGPTMSDLSPYQSTSAFAGNTEFISIEEIGKKAWFNKADYPKFVDDSGFDPGEKATWLKFAFSQFNASSTPSINDSTNDFNIFCEAQKNWLDEYALYASLKNIFSGRSWLDWPEKLRDRDDFAIQEAKKTHADDVAYVKFVQYLFFQQWERLKKYANEKGVSIFGDLPLFVSHDSADVWENKALFKLDVEGRPTFVAGVPPDYFSETGQRWGNPVYDWKIHEVDNFSWWLKRLNHQFALFDLVRIDHFRGLAAYWEIPAEHETALNGSWVPAPGEKMLSVIQQAYAQANDSKMLPLIAEDLGVITDDVVELKDQFQLPGMKILQFAFGGDASNPYLPHNHEVDCVIYTGTHDNNTTLGWFNALDEDAKSHVYRYLDSHESMPWLLVRSAYASVANRVVLPMQDLMGLGENGRMNVPGTVDSNWLWRFQWQELDKPRAIEYMNMLNVLYGR